MGNFISLNFGWILLMAAGLAAIIVSAKNFKKPPVTEVSRNFQQNPVLRNNPYENVFRAAAFAAIHEDKNPWVYLQENWELARTKGSVKNGLIEFITKNAGQKIPEGTNDISLSVRDYSDKNSIVMEFRDPKDGVVKTASGHDPEPALYASFSNGNETRTYKLICANGLVEELGGVNTSYKESYVVKQGDCVVSITGMTPKEASDFATTYKLPVRVTYKEYILQTPTKEKSRVFKKYQDLLNKGKKATFDVVIQPGNILEKENGIWQFAIHQN